jgi:hypothetical protein
MEKEDNEDNDKQEGDFAEQSKGIDIMIVKCKEGIFYIDSFDITTSTSSSVIEGKV